MKGWRESPVKSDHPRKDASHVDEDILDPPVLDKQPQIALVEAKKKPFLLSSTKIADKCLFFLIL